MIKLLKNNVKCHGHLKVKVIIGWLMRKLWEENETLTQIVNDTRRPTACPPTRIVSPIYKRKSSSENPAKNYVNVTQTSFGVPSNNFCNDFFDCDVKFPFTVVKYKSELIKENSFPFKSITLIASLYNHTVYMYYKYILTTRENHLNKHLMWQLNENFC